MAYLLESITMRAHNTVEGMEKVQEVWLDITSGRLPLIFDSAHEFQQGLSPISEYFDYEGDSTGSYTLTIRAVRSDFFAAMDQKVQAGTYKKYEATSDDGNVVTAAEKAWKQVEDDEKSGAIHRTYRRDYESTVPPAYNPKGVALCVLYIAVQ